MWCNVVLCSLFSLVKISIAQLFQVLKIVASIIELKLSHVCAQQVLEHGLGVVNTVQHEMQRH